MKANWRVWTGLLVIVILAWLELQFFSEAYVTSEQKRKIAHVIFLVAVMVTGYIGLYKHPVSWLKHIWITAYSIMLAIVLTIGLLEWKVTDFAIGFLDEIRNLRVFFTSPIPYMALLVVSSKRFAKQKQS